jgi:hypothetical protein
MNIRKSKMFPFQRLNVHNGVMLPSEYFSMLNSVIVIHYYLKLKFQEHSSTIQRHLNITWY